MLPSYLKEVLKWCFPSQITCFHQQVAKSLLKLQQDWLPRLFWGCYQDNEKESPILPAKWFPQETRGMCVWGGCAREQVRGARGCKNKFWLPGTFLKTDLPETAVLLTCASWHEELYLEKPKNNWKFQFCQCPPCHRQLGFAESLSLTLTLIKTKISH